VLGVELWVMKVLLIFVLSLWANFSLLKKAEDKKKQAD
jgi:hypothetical protein